MSNHVFGTKDHFDRVCAHLVTHGVSSVSVEFDGRGDSGSITDVSLYFADKSKSYEDSQALLAVQLQAVVTKSVFDNTSGRWVKQTYEAISSLEDILKDATYAALDEAGHDWYNNDGGFGTLMLKLNNANGKPELVLDIHIREIKTDDYTYEFTSGEMVATAEPEEP
jgi:hypothetical protein